MGGDAGGTGPCRQDLCHVSPTLCPGAAAAAPTARSPYGLGPPLHLGTEIVQGMWGLGEGQLLSLRQKDAGQHFIRNHLNVFAVFRIRALVGWVGCLGSGVRRFHLSSRLHVSVGRGCGASRQLLWELMTTSPDHLGAHSEGLSRSLCLERSVR